MAHTLTGKASGLCIGTDGGTGTGTALRLANCNDSAVQRWTIHS